MSLTSFINQKHVRQKFKDEFQVPEFKIKGELKANPLTKNYSLICTAFDYLMRFYLQRINSKSISSSWVAENSLIIPKNNIKIGKIAEVEKIISQAKKNHKKYIGNGKINDNLLKSCLCLVQLDILYRSEYFYKNLGKIKNLDVKDLKNLFFLINPEIFKSKKLCLLNPTFGRASFLIGGADADLVIDNTLIEIKTTKFLKLNRNHFNQIVGYYFLSIIGNLNGAPKKHKINNLGIYFSRHGLLYTFPVRKITNPIKNKKFIKWFKKNAFSKELKDILSKLKRLKQKH